MQKWEYLQVVIEPPPARAEGYLVNGVVYNYVQTESFFTLFAKLGREGWELVCRDSASFYFKRPLAA